MTRRDAAQIEAGVEAAFDRYNRAVLSGVEPTAARFIESLEAEGLSLSLSRHRADETEPVQRRTADQPSRNGALPVGRRAAGRLAARLKGLT